MSHAQRRHQSYLRDQRGHFDELVTSEWDTYANPDWDRSRRFELQRLFKRVRPRTVLDVGCGVGFHDLEMARMAGVSGVVGIDYSEKSIEAAEREYPHPNVTRRVGDVFEMDDGAFDLVVSFQVIEHLDDPVAFLNACGRQARPGGHVFIATPNRDRLYNRYLRLRGRTPELADPQHYQEFNRADIRRLGVEAGLRPRGGFGYGMTMFIPWNGRNAIPRRIGLRAGALVPAVADVICEMFEAPAAEDLAGPGSNLIYDRVAATYGTEDDESESARVKHELLGRYLSADAKVLDVGCANGVHLVEVARRCSRADGVDPSAEMLSECQRLLDATGITGVGLHQGSAESLPFDDESFDLVYCYSTLFLVRDGRRALAEMARVLRPGGIALLDIAGRRNLSQRHWSRWWTEQGLTGFTVFDRGEMVEFLAQLGLRICEDHALGALDQIKYLPRASGFSLGEHRAGGIGRSLDYRLSNLGALDRLANRWYVAAEKT